MGNQSSLVVFDVEEWEEISEARFSSIIRHRSSQQELEKYLLNIPERAITQWDREIYRARKNNKHGWVPILYHFRQPFSSFCGGKGNYFVITERFTRLSELKGKINSEQGLIYLMDALNGYSSLVSQFGYFDITAGMMAIDQKGDLKVWFNENFASNSKSIDENSKLDCKTVILTIVKTICDRVEDCDYQRIFDSSSKYRLNFADACHILANYKSCRSSTIRNYQHKPAKHTSKRRRMNQQKIKENEYLEKTEKLCDYASRRQKQSKREREFNRSMLVIPESVEHTQYSSVNGADLFPPKINLQLSPKQTSNKLFRKAQEGPLRQLVEQQVFMIKTDNRPRISTTLVHSPTMKQSTPIIGSEFLRTNRLQSTKAYETSEKVKFYNIEDTNCNTMDSPKGESYRLPYKLKPVIIEKCSSKKSLSMLASNSKNQSSRRRLQQYEEIQRIDSVLMLGQLPISEQEQQHVVVIESTILKS